jgi:hypothetical protein
LMSPCVWKCHGEQSEHGMYPKSGFVTLKSRLDAFRIQADCIQGILNWTPALCV